MPRPLVYLALVFAALPLPARAGPAADDFALRVAAAESLAAKNDPRALGLLRDLLQEQPADARLCFRYGYALAVQALDQPEGKARTAQIREARAYLLKAKAGGEDDPLIDDALRRFREDGTIVRGPALADTAQANAIMQEAEKAFAKGDTARALRGYGDALKLDPTNYHATLWTGDAYYSQGKLADAVAWFEKAAALKPDAETAYRYRADALLRLGRPDEAIDAYIAAVVAEPYNPLPLKRFVENAEHLGYNPGFRARRLPAAQLEFKDGKRNILVDEKGGILALAYGSARAEWVEKHGTAADEKSPHRQTLAEEVAGLKGMLALYRSAKSSPGTPSPEFTEYATELADLAEISEAGLLEPHVLYARANADLAQDYAAYRAGHRTELALYLREFFLGKK